MPREYGFEERLQMSEGISSTKSIEEILLANIPGAQRVVRAARSADRNGTDYWVHHARGKPYSVDVKARSEDWAFKPEPNTRDDLALETWSVVENQVIGWTRDERKMTDYVLWFWKDSGRWCLVPFAMLCSVFAEFWEEWIFRFETARQQTPWNGGSYHSECVYVPRRDVWAAIYKRFGGTVLRPARGTS